MAAAAATAAGATKAWPTGWHVHGLIAVGGELRCFCAPMWLVGDEQCVRLPAGPEESDQTVFRIARDAIRFELQRPSAHGPYACANDKCADFFSDVVEAYDAGVGDSAVIGAAAANSSAAAHARADEKASTAPASTAPMQAAARVSGAVADAKGNAKAAEAVHYHVRFWADERVCDWVCVRAGNRSDVGHVVKLPRHLFRTEMDADWNCRLAVPLKHKSVESFELQSAAHNAQDCPYGAHRKVTRGTKS